MLWTPFPFLYTSSVGGPADTRFTSTTVVTAAPPSPITSGAGVVFTATITTTGTATGTVQFYDGATPLGSAVAVSANAASTPSITNLSVGSHSITAIYGGDATHQPSGSNTLTYVVNAISSTIAVTGVPASPTTSGTGVVFTGTVTATGSPTGTVRFQDGGVDMTGFTNPVTMSGNTASTPSITTLSVAAHTITGIYSGDATHAGSTSSGYSHTVTSGGADTTTGLVGYWPMSEGSGSTFNDGSGNGFNGTLSGTPAWNPGVSILFNGAFAGHVTDKTLFNPGSAFTAFCWVNSAGGAAGTTLFAQYDFGTSNRAWAMQTDASAGTKLRIVLSDDGAGTKKIYEGSQTLFDSALHSCAFRWNAGTLDLFVDGFKDPSTTKLTDVAMATIFNATCDLTFGALLNSGAEAAGIGAEMQRFRLYNIAKTDADIAAIHALGHA